MAELGIIYGIISEERTKLQLYRLLCNAVAIINPRSQHIGAEIAVSKNEFLIPNINIGF